MCLIHLLGGGHSVELMLEGRFFFNWLVDPIPAPINASFTFRYIISSRTHNERYVF